MKTYIFIHDHDWSLCKTSQKCEGFAAMQSVLKCMLLEHWQFVASLSKVHLSISVHLSVSVGLSVSI